MGTLLNSPRYTSTSPSASASPRVQSSTPAPCARPPCHSPSYRRPPRHCAAPAPLCRAPPPLPLQRSDSLSPQQLFRERRCDAPPAARPALLFRALRRSLPLQRRTHESPNHPLQAETLPAWARATRAARAARRREAHARLARRP